jgi:hypothetical protein
MHHFDLIVNFDLDLDLSGDVDSDVLLEYIQAKSPIYLGVESRITFTEYSCGTNTAPPTPVFSQLALLATLLVSLLTTRV